MTLDSIASVRDNVNAKEVVKVTPVEIQSSNIKLVPYGLKFENDVSKEEWTNAFLSLQHANTVYQWYLGDLIVQADWQWKGEMYDMMMDATGMEYQTLRVFSTIARAYPQEIRQFVYDSIVDSNQQSKIGHTHFRVAASLMGEHTEKAVDFLVKAGKEGWTVEKLREQIARWKNGGTLPEPKHYEEPELPDGWAPIKEAKEFHGYIPSPDRLDSHKSSVPVEIDDWEIEVLIDIISEEPRLVSLVGRLELALRGIE